MCVFNNIMTLYMYLNTKIQVINYNNNKLANKNRKLIILEHTIVLSETMQRSRSNLWERITMSGTWHEQSPRALIHAISFRLMEVIWACSMGSFSNNSLSWSSSPGIHLSMWSINPCTLLNTFPHI